ncbi:protein mono-ADP-ribosyltransferase PARP10 isoform X3 [Rhinolophus sinicus]|uniref:protein mono-ADP-ribosyltransferase PARP10 isoform X3 n=1 Tax=Rhinolophus sinicus TaxID=89399 RepID=UPI003D7AE532
MTEAEAEVGAALELSGLPPHVPDELLTLYFENRRRSGGGPVLSWQRLGCGGVLTFREPADAERVLAQEEHKLRDAQLSLRPAPPRAPARLLLQGLPPGTTPQHWEQHVQALLRAIGHPEQACRALDSPRPDRALVQLPKPLSETAAERVLQQEHQLQGSELNLVPHYDVLEPEGLDENTSRRDHSAKLGHGATEHAHLEAGGPARALMDAGTVISGSEEPPGQSRASLSTGPIGSLEQTRPLSSGPMGSLGQAGLVSLGPTGSPGPVGSEIATGSPEQEWLESLGPVGSPEQEKLENLGSVGSPEQEELENLWPVESPEQEGMESLGHVGSPEQEELENLWPVESPEQEWLESLWPVGSPEQEGMESLGHVGSPEQEGLVEVVLSMEPGAMRFIQLYHEDLLAGLGDVALFPLEGSDVTGFRLCGALAPCQAAEDFLQSLLCSVSCHMLSLKHPGSARFLLGPQGQHLLRGLEAQFQCVFGTERLARDTLDMDPSEVDPTEALQALSGQYRTLSPSGSDQENPSLEEVQEMLATLEGLDGEDWPPLELGEEEPEEEPAPRAGEEPLAPSTGAPGRLEEEAALQLALHQSLQPQGQLAEQKEAAALQQALALSLLEPSLWEAGELPGGAAGQAQLVVHAAFEQDMDELDRAVAAALELHLREEMVGLRGHVLPAELCARLEWCHSVSVTLDSECAILRGFGAQPSRAARHLAALLAGPRDQSVACVSEASSPTCECNLGLGSGVGQFSGSSTPGMARTLFLPHVSVPQQMPNGPLGRLECLGESSREFQAVVQAFYDTLDAVHSRVHIIRVERVLHPLLRQQYELHRERLVQRCERRPAEHVLYHGTTATAVSDICAYGFNRSFCGRNGTLYGQGVYFAKRASLSVQDRYSPPNAYGHKAVFVARVLTGDYGQGRRGLRAPPLRAPGHTLLRYDSAVDCLHQPSIFVIFHDTQALPTHLITCEHRPQASPGNPSELLGHFPATYL